jgi:hypothetical protein
MVNMRMGRDGNHGAEEEISVVINVAEMEFATLKEEEDTRTNEIIKVEIFHVSMIVDKVIMEDEVRKNFAI